MTQQMQVEAQRRQDEALEAMRRRLLEPHGYITQVKIAAGVGKATHETLESEGRIFESYGATSGDLCPIASEEDLRQWLACRSEAELASLAAPVVRRLRQLQAPWDPNLHKRDGPLSKIVGHHVTHSLLIFNDAGKSLPPSSRAPTADPRELMSRRAAVTLDASTGAMSPLL